MLVFQWRWRWTFSLSSRRITMQFQCSLCTSAKKRRWKFRWQFCLCIKNWRGNFHGHFAFVSKTDIEKSTAICLCIKNWHGNFHGHFVFVSKLAWKFPWPFCLFIKIDMEISMAILLLYQKLTWKFPWLFCRCIKNWCWKFPWPFFNLFFVDGRQHILSPRADVSYFICCTEEKERLRDGVASCVPVSCCPGFKFRINYETLPQNS